MMDTIPVAGPWITEKEIRYVAEAAKNAWYSNANCYNLKFEKQFADYVGLKYAVSLPSCTSAIHLSLLALGIGPGDEVIVPDITWIATAAPISYVGATPVFADVDATSWCLSAEALECCITPRTRAVIPVDLYGNVPAWDSIINIARKHGLAVIEDAAEAIGSEYKQRKAGSFGDTGVFSFHGSKTLVTGEGGMLVTDRRDLFEKVQVLRDHGRRPGDILFFNTMVAYKYKMGAFQAALGLAQLERIADLIDRKRQIFQWYRERLEGTNGLQVNAEPPETLNTYWMVTAILDPSYGLPKERLMQCLAERHIASRPFFFPLSSIPAYEGYAEARKARDRNMVGYRLSPYGVNLPSGFNLDEPQVDYVCRSLKAIMADKGA